MSEEVIHIKSEDGNVSGGDYRMILERAGLTTAAEASKKLAALTERVAGSHASGEEALSAVAVYVEQSNKVLVEAIMQLENRILRNAPEGGNRNIQVEIEES